jgi:hypothetical protein
MIEFNIRIDFFRDLEDGPKGYVGSAMPSRSRRGPDVDQERNERRRFQDRDALTCWVGWWACQDLNLGPHPYQRSTVERRAIQHSPRPGGSVRTVGMG